MILTAMLAATALQMDALLEHGLQITTPSVTYTTFFNADGTYTTDVGIEGTWEMRGDEICVVRSTGEGGCAPVQADAALGDTWEGINAATGETVTYTIVPRG
ncbi:hypothetical protein [Maricaulis sp.]|uniref:hypothetical protein n=1 Tax=Maricaulis sp. TaxID=1486257 RepID=UPI00263593E7|nr:hypothetical protein [Maricaulis sp.]